MDDDYDRQLTPSASRFRALLDDVDDLIFSTPVNDVTFFSPQQVTEEELQVRVIFFERDKD